MTHPELQEQIDHLNRCDAYDVIAVPRGHNPSQYSQSNSRKDTALDVLAIVIFVAFLGLGGAGLFLSLRGVGFFQTPNEQLTQQNAEMTEQIAVLTTQVETIQKTVCEVER
jgi:hypothetical protein